VGKGALLRAVPTPSVAWARRKRAFARPTMLHMWRAIRPTV